MCRILPVHAEAVSDDNFMIIPLINIATMRMDRNYAFICDFFEYIAFKDLLK